MRNVWRVLVTILWAICLIGIWADYVDGKPTVWAPIWATIAILSAIIDQWDGRGGAFE